MLTTIYRILRSPEPIEGEGDPVPAPTTKADPPADTTKGGKADDKLFTQADLDRVVKERLEREQAKSKAAQEATQKAAEEKALKEQGEWKSLAEKREAELKERDDKLTAAEQALQQTRLAHAVEVAAKDLNFADPEDAQKLGNFTEVAFDDKGQPDKAAIKKALDALAKAKPHLVGRQVPRGTPPNARGAPAPAVDLTKRRPASRSSALS